MLGPERIKPLILSPDPWLAEAAIQYFTRSWSRDPEVAGLIIESLERYRRDTDHNLRVFHGLTSVPLALEHLDRLLALLEGADEPEVLSIGACLGHFPLDHLRARQDRLLEHPRLALWHGDTVELRLEVAGRPAGDLWRELKEAARREIETEEDAWDAPSWYARVFELCGREEPDPGTLLDALASPDFQESSLHPALISIAGARRLREAIPLLLEILADEKNGLAGESAACLARIGGPAVVEAISGRFASGSEAFRSRSAAVLGCLPSTASEDALLALLEREREPQPRQALLQALLALFSEEGARRALQVLEASQVQEEPGAADPGELQDTLLTVHHALGWEDPRHALWRDEREKREEERSRSALELHGKIQEYMLSLDEKKREIAVLEEELRRRGYEPSGELEGGEDLALAGEAGLDEEEDASEPLEGPGERPGRTLRRTEPKVGRNDPCPCGSGRKYKKCCGKG